VAGRSTGSALAPCRWLLVIGVGIGLDLGLATITAPYLEYGPGSHGTHPWTKGWSLSVYSCVGKPPPSELCGRVVKYVEPWAGAKPQPFPPPNKDLVKHK
jgi:hypothetical protein